MERHEKPRLNGNSFLPQIRKSVFSMRIVKHWNRSDRKVLQLPYLEVVNAQLVETLCTLINLTGKAELFYDSKMFRVSFPHCFGIKISWHVYSFSYFPYFLFCFLFINRNWQKALEDSEPDGLSTCQTLNTRACADKWGNHRSDQSTSATITCYRDLLAQATPDPVPPPETKHFFWVSVQCFAFFSNIHLKWNYCGYF